MPKTETDEIFCITAPEADDEWTKAIQTDKEIISHIWILKPHNNRISELDCHNQAPCIITTEAGDAAIPGEGQNPGQ